MNLYITADRIGGPGGGSTVTYQEREALRSLGEVSDWDRTIFESVFKDGFVPDTGEPWRYDDAFHPILVMQKMRVPPITHFYAGTWTRTIEEMKKQGYKITYTAAAHDIDLSRREHEKLGLQYDYKHLTDPALWERYVSGYLAADLVICPSTHSAECMRRYGCKNIKVIPHGVDLPKEIAPLPKEFTVGCLGAVHGPDKGLIYLLQAWKQLNYKDALLVIAGPHSQSQFIIDLINKYGGGKIWLRGWVDNVSDFYRDISLYVQPSVTEGFGIEVLEAYAHGRSVLCSEGAGAADCVPTECRFSPCDSDSLANMISNYRERNKKNLHIDCQLIANQYTWDKIRVQYQNLWKELLAC